MLSKKNERVHIWKHLPITMDEVCEANGVSKKNLKRLTDKHILYKQCEEDLKGCKFSTPKIYFKARASFIEDKELAYREIKRGVSDKLLHRKIGSDKTIIAYCYRGGAHEVGLNEVKEK